MNYKIHLITGNQLFISLTNELSSSFVKWLAKDPEIFDLGLIVKWDKYFINKNAIVFVEEC